MCILSIRFDITIGTFILEEEVAFGASCERT